MFGFLVALFDLGVLAHGSIQNGIKSAENRAEAKSIGRSWYTAGNGQTRLVINDHKASVSAEGVRDLVTGELVEDYKANREREAAEREAKWKAYEEERIQKAYQEAKENDYGNTWVSIYGAGHYNLKTGMKAQRCPNYGELRECEYKYYVDFEQFHYDHTPDSKRREDCFRTFKQEKSEFAKNFIYKNQVDWLYEKYLKAIEHNKRVFEKYNNIDFVEKNKIELEPVSRKDFLHKFDTI